MKKILSIMVVGVSLVGSILPINAQKFSNIEIEASSTLEQKYKSAEVVEARNKKSTSESTTEIQALIEPAPTLTYNYPVSTTINAESYLGQLISFELENQDNADLVGTPSSPGFQYRYEISSNESFLGYYYTASYDSYFSDSTAKAERISNLLVLPFEGANYIRIRIIDNEGADSVTLTPVLTINRYENQLRNRIYRFWSDSLQRHFYTVSENERDDVRSRWGATWNVYEGGVYYVPKCDDPLATSVYRFWSDSLQAHFYTSNYQEANQTAQNPDWAYENVAYCVYNTLYDSDNQKPVFRFWSDSKMTHFYTNNTSERDAVKSKWPDVWNNYEGKVFYSI